MRTGAILAVVGVSFHQDAVRTVQVGDHVTLVHEPDNPYDANAFAVKDAEGAVLGHIPATLAPRFTNPASGGTRGARWAGTVADLTHHEDNVGLRVRLDTELPPPPGAPRRRRPGRRNGHYCALPLERERALHASARFVHRK